jgi:DNA polymerase-3 subunit gamma/tau
MLSQAAFNAFLKTLEEPPAHAIFILATTEKHKIIPTILSRCQIFDFKRITVLDTKKFLKSISKKEGIIADDDALHIIAQKADGAMRDALSIFDRVISFTGNELTREAVTQNLNVLDYDTYFSMTDLLLDNKIPEVLNFFNSILAKGFEGHHFINGLASHFRDILVAKDNSTISLLEVGDTAKKKYLEQSSKASISFLIKSIEKANQCDLNYRTSKNQRLLVELTLMQIASITFDGEKKKSTNFIIPATFFTSLSPTKKQDLVEEVKPETITKEVSDDAVVKVISNPKEIAKPPIIQNLKRRNNSLSLKSIHQKKKQQKTSTEINYENYPKDSFSVKDLRKTWSDYQKIQTKKGEKNMASILAASLPELSENFKVHFILPNKLMEDQLKIGKPKLLMFLRESLNNFSITVDVSVSETIEKKFAYTPQEKYNKLKEKNPLLEKLKDTFQLDL